MGKRRTPMTLARVHAFELNSLLTTISRFPMTSSIAALA
jgi:hypothetical protein